MKIHKNDTAVVVIDPQNDVLSEKGVSWGLVGDSVKENNTVENLVRLFRATKEQGFGVFISPHYLYPTDQAWQFGGAVEKMMLEGKEFWRPGPLDLDGFSGSGADWLECYKPFIEDGKTVVVSPHKVWGPQTNDLNIFYRRDDMPTPVETFRHSLSVSSLQPPPSALVACGQDLRQSTMGEGHRAGSNVGTEIAK